MAENYKHLYHQMKKMVEQYQDVIVPGLRELLAKRVEVVRCKDCRKWDCYGGEDSHKGDCSELVGLESCMYEDDFCSYGERKGGDPE